MFRSQIEHGTFLGIEAKKFIDKGELVPNNVTVPMLLDAIRGKDDWILDGFPRNVVQAESLWNALQKEDVKIDIVVQIDISQEEAKKRIMGRRICTGNSHHPNNVSNPEILPVDENYCRVCGEPLKTRKDDQDEVAVDKRLNIYNDPGDGTMGAVIFFRTRFESSGLPKFVKLSGEGSISDTWKHFKQVLKI